MARANKLKDLETSTDQVFSAIQDAATEPGKEKPEKQHVSLALDKDNYLYAKTMAALYGGSMQDFINQLITKSREDNGPLYKQIKDFRANLK